MKKIEVLLPLACNLTFSYLAPDEMQIGDYVLVPFRNSQIIGIIWQMSIGNHTYKLKNIIKRIKILPMHKALIRTVDFIADYNLAPKGMVLKMTMQTNVVEKITIFPIKHNNAEKPDLSNEHRALSKKLGHKILNDKFSVTLLEGASGSGKIGIYCAIAAFILNAEIGQILILVPEILSATQMINYLQQHIKIAPIEWHSTLTPKQKNAKWLEIKYGNVQLIVGTRSALLLPYNNLQLIIVDEEHDNSFKQDQQLNYNARDMAIIRAKEEEIPVFLVSATPSLETIHNVSLGKFEHLSLSAHLNTKPHIDIIDMRNKKTRNHSRWISSSLIQALEKNLDEGKKAMIFLNRRGYNPYTICNDCKYKLKCINCSTPLIWYEQKKFWRCNYCSYKLSNASCPDCAGELITYGAGIELIEQEISRLFPEAVTAIITGNTTPKQTKKIIQDINEGKINIIIGTQTIAKCENFPNLTLLGIIDADIGSFSNDLRALERTYQLLYQIAGKKCESQVILQTHCPNNIVIKALSSFKRDDFYKHELAARKKFFMPPFSRLASITFAHKERDTALKMACEALRQAPPNHQIKIMGPASAPLFMIQGKYRYKILIKADREFKLQSYILRWQQKSKMKAKIDIDPINFA